MMKKHATTTEAINLINEVQPWRSILTHFSCRYLKVAEILPEHSSSKCLVAFDHMRLRLKDFEWAYKYLETFAQCFSNEKEKEVIDVVQKK